MQRWVYVVLSLLSLVVHSEAVERFVAPTGTGSTCSLVAPCSLDTALTLEASGDIITLRGGTYAGAIIDTITSGTSSARTTVRAYPGEVPTIVGTWTDAVIFMNNRSWILLEGLALDGNFVAGNGIIHDGAGSNSIFRQLKISRNRNLGILQDNLQNTTLLENLEIFNNGDSDLGFEHGIYLGAGNGHIIRGCSIHDNLWGYGMQLWEPGSNVLVEQNIFYNNYRHLWLGGAHPIVRNNLFWGSVKDGVISHAETLDFFNNTITGAAQDCGLVQAAGANAEVKNNIVFGNSTNICAPTFGVHANNTTTDPLWVNAAAGDFHLQSGSSAIDTGLTLPGVTVDLVGVVRPHGSAVDRGAYEFTGADPPPTIAASVALDLRAPCATEANSLNAQVAGSLFYLAADAAFNATALVHSECASAITIVETVSLLGGGFSAVAPWVFAGTPGPNVNNTCTNCLSVHNGTISTNASGSGWTLPTFREGATVAAATGGTSVYTLLPGLCTQVVAGITTSTPLWPWPMEARIQAARSLAGVPARAITDIVQGLVGPIPPACIATPPPATPTTWYLAPTGGVDGGACSLTAPCATIPHVTGRMASGDTLLLRGGTYTQRLLPGQFPGGTSWAAPTIVASYTDETAVLQLSSGIVAEFAAPATDRYLVLDRLTLDGMAPTATTTQGLVVRGNAGPIRFQNGVIRQTHAERVLLDTAIGVEILDSLLEGGTTLPAVRLRGTTNGTLLRGNTIQSGPTEGIELRDGLLTNTRISRNTVTGHGTTCILLSAGQGTVLDNNVLADCGTGLWLMPGPTDTQSVNNTIADQTGTGLRIDSGALDTVVTNTLVFGNGTDLVDTGTRTVVTTTLTTDPGFVGGGDYHLALATSPAADTGTALSAGVAVARDGVTRPVGAGWDIGAYERAGAGPPPPGPLSASPWGARFFLVP